MYSRDPFPAEKQANFRHGFCQYAFAIPAAEYYEMNYQKGR